MANRSRLSKPRREAFDRAVAERANKEVDEASTFNVWLKNSKRGDRCVYHYGNLMRDRQLTPRGDAAYKNGVGCRLDVLANTVLKAAEDGVVAAFQKRISEGMCEYYVVRQ